MANLIVYYSRKGENYWNGSIKNLSKGNTERVAEFIQNAVGGDLFEVETVKEYAQDYYKCIEEAKQELREKARPDLKEYLGNLDEYDTIFVGYPKLQYPIRCVQRVRCKGNGGKQNCIHSRKKKVCIVLGRDRS